MGVVAVKHDIENRNIIIWHLSWVKKDNGYDLTLIERVFTAGMYKNSINEKEQTTRRWAEDKGRSLPT